MDSRVGGADPTQKLRRRVIEQRYAATVEALYAESPAGYPLEEVSPTTART
jgi:hypothetical protein